MIPCLIYHIEFCFDVYYYLCYSEFYTSTSPYIMLYLLKNIHLFIYFGYCSQNGYVILSDNDDIIS